MFFDLSTNPKLINIMNINMKKIIITSITESKWGYRKRQSIPILSNVLFQCDAQQLIITATDTVEVNTVMSLGTQEQAKVAIPGNYLTFVRASKALI